MVVAAPLRTASPMRRLLLLSLPCLLAACASDAPPLPSHGTAAPNIYVGNQCGDLAYRLQSVNAQMAQLDATIAADLQHNQTMGFAGNFLPITVLATEDKATEKAAYAQMTADRDQIYAAMRASNCPM